MRTLLGLLAGVALATAVIVVASAQEPQPPKTDDARFTVKATPEMIRHSRIADLLYFVELGWAGAMMLILLLSGASRKMRDLAMRVTKRPFVVAMITIALFICACAVLSFPLAYYSDYYVSHQFDLSDQSFASWMGDMFKGLAVNLVIMMPVGALAFLALRHFRRWWLVLWACSIPLILLMVIIQPLVLDPLFNKFEPLHDQVLKAKLLDLASRAGIEGGRVYEVDKSKQTKTMNAYVNGIGPSARIVMWDTLLQKLDHDEVLAVMGHEMGHYVLKHIWKGLAFSLAISFFVFFVGQKVIEKPLPRWQIEKAGDPAALPWILLVFGAIGFFLSPVTSGFSRHLEHEADKFSLELTHLNEPMATAFVKMAEDSKRDPSPNVLIEYWRYSHPPIAKRIPFALSYKPWESGAK